MFGSLFDLATNVVKIAVAPIEVVATVANAAVKPVAKEITELVKDLKNDLK